MPSKKRVKKSRARKPVKKGLKQKQKQKQQQKVNVSVSAGGSGGGGTQFIPMPSAPAFDYALLANLIRPAATVDVPIRAQANPEPMAARAPEAAPLKESARPSRAAPSIPSFVGEMESSRYKSSKPFIATPAATDFPSESESEFVSPKKGKGRPKGSTNKPKPVAYAVEAESEFMPARGGEFERMIQAQKSGSFM